MLVEELGLPSTRERKGKTKSNTKRRQAARGDFICAHIGYSYGGDRRHSSFPLVPAHMLTHAINEGTLRIPLNMQAQASCMGQVLEEGVVPLDHWLHFW